VTIEESTSLRLTVLEEPLAVCRLDPEAEVPPWAGSAVGGISSVTRTTEELSVVCPERAVPRGVLCERGWRALKMEGPFDLSLVGILASVVAPLADAAVNVFVTATYDTDYVLVKDENLELAVDALRGRGHEIS
jgi:uncharacterized protein